ncbi:MAG: glycosyltransferase family 4 protein [Alphaproteobacteria bacterium]|nr:glycosyltransferase family 4 protein [Alphaproteobacteria bacterium]
MDNPLHQANRNNDPRRILIIVDKYGWSYDAIARGIKDHVDDDVIIDIMSEKADAETIRREHGRYDLVFAMGWTSVFEKKKKTSHAEKLDFIDKARLITGVHSHRSWDDYRSTPDWSPDPSPELIEKLASLKAVNTVSRRLFRMFRKAGLDNLVLTENGVDTDLFRPTQPVNIDRTRPLVIGFSGSTGIQKHDDLKGLSAFILPLGELPNVEIRVLGERGPKQVARAAMPALYNSIDLYICASTSEGFSQSVLEASACGRSVLSTKVGGSEDLIEAGATGYFIERDLEQIQRLVTTLEQNRVTVARLGARNRQHVLDRYAWRVRVKDWLDFMRASLPATVH